MRNILKAATLESKFPLLAVESDCIVSKDADITVAFEVELPELFTVTSAEYAAIHAAWCKAVKVLPDYTVVHKQDWFVKEHYRSRTEGEKLGFLSRSYELHFNERPFLNHCCYLYLTKTTKERMRMQSSFSSLCRGFIIPKEVNRDTAARFLDAAGQFARIVNDTGLVRLRRLSGDEVTGTEEQSGLLEKYLCLSLEDTCTLEDIELGDDGVRIGDKRLSVYTLSELDALPGRVGTDSRYERLSTDRSDCRLSFASPVGLLLPCNHIYNQYLFIDDSAENLQRFEKTARNMQSLSRYSRSNQINKEWIDLYLNDAHSYGLTSVRCHCNVIAWTDNPDEVKVIRNDTGSQIAAMECKPRHDTVDAATLYWAGMPGQRRRLPGGGIVLYLHRTGRLLLDGGNELPQFAFPFRAEDVRPHQRQTAARGHLRPADETGHHHQPQQVRAGRFGQRQVILHEPLGTAILRTRNAHRIGGHRKLV